MTYDKAKCKIEYRPLNDKEAEIEVGIGIDGYPVKMNCPECGGFVAWDLWGFTCIKCAITGEAYKLKPGPKDPTQ